jgi:riboflavin kinase/FMN adenylyltransferase
VGVEFAARLRPMRTFSGVPELVAAMDADVAHTRRLLGLPDGPGDR